ncbi:MAG: S8 family serine peptidase [Alphaproteobacteria bacterium]
MSPLQLVKLDALMDRTGGSPEVTIGLVDGPVITAHPDLEYNSLRELPGTNGAACTLADSTACLHGTFVAGVLSARRTSPAPAICPGCTLLIRPVFAEGGPGREYMGREYMGRDYMPSATPPELAAAIVECVDAGARLINLSLALTQHSTRGEQALQDALDHAVKRGAIVVAAAGNQGALGSSPLTRHPWVIPVAACNLAGQPVNGSNFGVSIGRRGLSAPGDGVTSLGTDSRPLTLGGTSVAAPFVTGALALLWSEFPAASAAQIRLAIGAAGARRRAAVVPPLLDAAALLQALAANGRKKETAI